MKFRCHDVKSLRPHTHTHTHTHTNLSGEPHRRSERSCPSSALGVSGVGGCEEGDSTAEVDYI